MHIAFALFADAANLSQEGKLNILGVFDALQVGTLPAMHPRASLVLRLKGSPDEVGTHSVGLRWTNPNGQELWSSEGELQVGPPPAGVSELDLPLIATVDLPLDVPGTYRMEVMLDKEAQTALVLQVRGDQTRPVGPTLVS